MRIIYNFPIFLFLICELFAVGFASLPSEIQKCKSKDNSECIKQTIKQIFQRYPTGNPELGMPNVSAFNLTNIKVSKSDSNSAVQINFKFLKCTMYANTNITILRASGFDKEMSNAQLDILAPSVKLEGDYEMTGKLLLFPINGNGKGNINMDDIDLKFKSQMNKEMRNNKTYFTVNKLKVQVEPKEVFVNLENLFNGSPVLSKTVNDVINENWRDVWLELKDGINHALETVYINIINDIFKDLPVEDMYLD